MAMIEVVILLLFILYIYIYLKWNFNYWEKRCIRGPKADLITGNFTRSARGDCSYVDELNEIYLKYKNREKFVGIFSSRNPKLFILDPEVVRQVLLTNFSSFYDNESSKWSMPYDELLRMQSPFVSVGNDWKQKRSEIVPALTVNRLRSLYPEMQEIAKELTYFIRSRSGENLDAKELSCRFTIELVAHFIWGIGANAFNGDKLCQIHQIANGMIQQTMKCVDFYVRTAAWPPIFRQFRKQRFFPESTDRYFTHLTKTLIKHRLENPIERSDVLDHLVNLLKKKNMSDAQLAGHSTTVLIDGFESAALVIAHCLLLLGRNKSAQDKLRSEILDNMDNEDGISFEKLNELPYLDQCIHETIRLFPPLSTFTKICTTATTLENSDGGKLRLKPGDMVHISAYSFHKDPDIFENPEEFSPERFDPNVGGYKKYRDRCVFLPFGDGPRMCLGMKLGLLEAKVAVAEVVRNFKINLSDSTRLDNRYDPKNIFSCLDGGIMLRFEKLKF